MYAYIYVKSFCNHGNMVTMSFSTSQPDSQKQSKLESVVSQFCTLKKTTEKSIKLLYIISLVLL